MSAIAPNLAAHSTEISSLLRQAAPAVAGIDSEGLPFSGFVWRAGIIVTASDRLEADTGARVSVSLEGQALQEGLVVGRDPATDVALIRLAGPVHQPLPASATPLELGQLVVALGRSRHGATCAIGAIALAGAAWQSMRGGDIAQRVWLDIRGVDTGEGAAVLDAAGRCVGMLVAGPRRRALVIPMATIDRVGEVLLANGRMPRGYLGVSVRPVPLAATGGGKADGRGLMVLGLEGGGPASRAGLLQGDIIVAVGGEAARSPRELARIVSRTPAGGTLGVDLLRAGNAARIEVVVGEGPAA